MLEPPIPDDEEERLAVLARYEILDSEPEPAFDALTELASHITGAPITLISIVDRDRQWFKSRHGLDASETSREISFCGHAIASKSTLVVEDATLDERFHDNPFVAGGPEIRFYCGVPLMSQEGQPLGTLCAIDDVPRTLDGVQHEMLEALAVQAMSLLELRRAVRERRRLDLENQYLASIVQSATDAIIGVDPDGRIRSWNPAATQIFGYEDDEVLGEPVTILAPDDEAGIFMREAIGHVLGGSHLEALETERRRKDGKTIPVSLRIHPVRGPDEAPIGISAVIRDLSEQRQFESMKQDFVSVVSHELRTPLTSIRGSLGLVIGGALGEVPERVRPLLEIACKNTDRLARLVNEILDVEKIAAGKMTFSREVVELAEIVDGSTRENESYAEREGVTFRFERPSEPALVCADADRVRQVVDNLLSNAAKFSPAQSDVVIELSPGTEYHEVAVLDRGPGVPDVFHKQIFERFAQHDASDSRARGGSGLGLHISRAIIEQHGGAIDFEPRPGGGTRFWFRLAAHDQTAQESRLSSGNNTDHATESQ